MVVQRLVYHQHGYHLKPAGDQKTHYKSSIAWDNEHVASNIENWDLHIWKKNKDLKLKMRKNELWQINFIVNGLIPGVSVVRIK